MAVSLCEDMLIWFLPFRENCWMTRASARARQGLRDSVSVLVYRFSILLRYAILPLKVAQILPKHKKNSYYEGETRAGRTIRMPSCLWLGSLFCTPSSPALPLLRRSAGSILSATTGVHLVRAPMPGVALETAVVRVRCQAHPDTFPLGGRFPQ